MNFDFHLLLFLSAFGVFVSLPGRAAEKRQLGIYDEATLELLDEAIERECRRYAEGPRLEFEFPKGAREVDELPDWMSDAEPGLKEAWRSFGKLRFAEIRFYEDQRRAKPRKPAEKINVLKETDAYLGILRRLLDGEHPPKPEELYAFHYPWDSFGYCDSPSIEVYANISTDAVILALLRGGQPQEALMLISGPCGRLVRARWQLLSAFGMDPVEIDIGRWLHGMSNAHESLIDYGGERAAKVLVDWSVRNWGRVAEYRRDPVSPWRGPDFPDYDLLRILSPGNEVCDATRKKLADLIVRRGAEIHRPGLWLSKLPEGAEPWLVGLARQALHAELNEDRRMAARILKAAGIDAGQPELRPNPKFRITVNGEPWPGTLPEGVRFDTPGIDVEFDNRTRVGRASRLRWIQGSEGLFEIDADFFVCPTRFPGPLVRAKIYDLPMSNNPKDPWIIAPVPLPPAFGKVTEISIRTRKVTIRPVYQRPTDQLEGLESTIEFGPVEEGRPPESPGSSYRMPATDPLVLSMVSDGSFWVRVRCEGSVVSEWVRIEVGEGRTDFSVKAPFGATVILPIKWAGGKPPQLPRWLEREIDRVGSSGNHPLLVKLERNGVETRPLRRISQAFRGKHPGCMVFPNLSPGEYEVSTRRIGDDRNDGKPFLKSASLRFRIDANTPPVLKTAPLVLETNRPAEK